MPSSERYTEEYEDAFAGCGGFEEFDAESEIESYHQSEQERARGNPRQYEEGSAASYRSSRPIEGRFEHEPAAYRLHHATEDEAIMSGGLHPDDERYSVEYEREGLPSYAPTPPKPSPSSSRSQSPEMHRARAERSSSRSESPEVQRPRARRSFDRTRTMGRGTPARRPEPQAFSPGRRYSQSSDSQSESGTESRSATPEGRRSPSITSTTSTRSRSTAEHNEGLDDDEIQRYIDSANLQMSSNIPLARRERMLATIHSFQHSRQMVQELFAQNGWRL